MSTKRRGVPVGLIVVVIFLLSVSPAAAHISVSSAPYSYDGDYSSCSGYAPSASDVRLDPVNIVFWDWGFRDDVKPCNDLHLSWPGAHPWTFGDQHFHTNGLEHIGHWIRRGQDSWSPVSSYYNPDRYHYRLMKVIGLSI
jgi:hypothetical protein